MRLDYLTLCIFFVCVLAISGCVDKSSSSPIPIKTDLGEHKVIFNLTPKYNYEIESQRSDRTPYQSFINWPAYNWSTRKIYDQNDMVRGITLSIRVFDEPMDTSMEALEKWDRFSAGKHVPTFSTYTLDRTYLIEEERIELKAQCWLDKKTLFSISTLKFDREDFLDILNSLEISQ